MEDTERTEINDDRALEAKCYNFTSLLLEELAPCPAW